MHINTLRYIKAAYRNRWMLKYSVPSNVAHAWYHMSSIIEITCIKNAYRLSRRVWFSRGAQVDHSSKTLKFTAT